MASRYIVKPFTAGTTTKYKIWDNKRKRFVINAVFSERGAAEGAAKEWEKTTP